MGTGEIGIVKNHFNTVIIIYMSIFNISFPVNLQPADKSSKPSNMKSDFTSTAKDSSPKETIAYICGLRARIECEPISEHSTRRDRVTNIGYRLFGGASPCELKQHFFHFLKSDISSLIKDEKIFISSFTSSPFLCSGRRYWIPFLRCASIRFST